MLVCNAKSSYMKQKTFAIHFLFTRNQNVDVELDPQAESNIPAKATKKDPQPMVRGLG